MRVTYGRERSKTARRATVDISPECGTTSAGRRSGRAPCCLHNNCRCNELCAIALRHPQMSPFPVSIERCDLIRTTLKPHRLSNITSAATSPAALPIRYFRSRPDSERTTEVAVLQTGAMSCKSLDSIMR